MKYTCNICKHCDALSTDYPCKVCSIINNSEISYFEPIPVPLHDDSVLVPVVMGSTILEALAPGEPDAPALDDAENNSHYKKHPSGVECIEIIQHMPYNVGAAMKYLWRCNDKHSSAIADLKKSKIMIDFEIKRLEEDGI